MIYKLSEVQLKTKTPIITNDTASILNKGEKLLFMGSSCDFSKFIAALATNSDYCGLKINCPGRVIYRDLFSSEGALVPYLSEAFKSINREDAYKNIQIHDEDPYHTYIDDEPDGIYKNGDVIIFDCARYPFDLPEKDLLKYINGTLARNNGATIIFSSQKYMPNLESTAHTIVQTKTKNVYFRGKNFVDFHTTKE